jgi:excisionase family DNA binding protein
MKELTIKQCAEVLGVSTQTIRRRIEKGELLARKEVTDVNERWLIQADQLNAATTNIDVIPVNRQLSVVEIQQAIQQVVAATVTSTIQAETVELKEQIYNLEEQVDKQSTAMNRHFELIDERLRNIVDEKPQPKSKSLWRSLFEWG